MPYPPRSEVRSSARTGWISSGLRCRKARNGSFEMGQDCSSRGLGFSPETAALQLFISLFGKVSLGLLWQEVTDLAQVRLVDLVDEGFPGQAVSAGRGLDAFREVLLDEPRHRG